MSVLAFAIVLTTFVVNDGLHDRAKELADSLDSGSRALSDHLALFRLDELVSYIARATGDICDTVHKSHGACSKFMTIEDIETLNANPHGEALEREESYFLYTLSLQNRIPYDKELDEMHWTITRALNLGVLFVNAQAEMDFYLKIKENARAMEVHRNGEWLRQALNENSAKIDKEFGLKSTFVDIPERQLALVMNRYNAAVNEHVRTEYEKAKHREEIWKYADLCSIHWAS